MRERGITQQNLARALGLGQSAISKWVNGTIPDSGNLGRLAVYLGVKVERLFAEPGPEPPAQDREVAEVARLLHVAKRRNPAAFKSLKEVITVYARSAARPDRVREALLEIVQREAEKIRRNRFAAGQAKSATAQPAE